MTLYNDQFIRHAFHPGFIGPAPTPITLLSADSFNRANSAVTLGSTDGAGSLDPLTWFAHKGTWGISSNTAYCPTLGSSPTEAHAEVHLLTGDVDSTITFTTLGSGSIALVFRYQDTFNCWFWLTASGSTGLYRRQSSSSVLQGSTHAGAANGDVMRVVSSGSAIQCYRNGSLLETKTDSFLSTEDEFGLYTSDTGARFDNWSASVA